LIRRGAAVALVCAVALVGCGRGPLRGSGAGVAARVGSSIITTRDLAETLDRALADPSYQEALNQQFGAKGTPAYTAAVADAERSILARLINRIVVGRLAAREGVTVTDADVTKTLADLGKEQGGAAALEKAAAQNGVPKADLRAAVRDVALGNAIRDRLVRDVKVPAAQLRAAYDRQYVEVHVAHILVKTKALADSVLAQLKGGTSFAALAKKYSEDTANKNKGGDLGFNGAGKLVTEFENAMFAAKPGQTVGPVQTQFGFHVIHVIGRRPVKGAKNLAAATPDIRRALLDQQAQQKFGDTATAYSAELGVSVNPRYGVWNPKQATVDPLNPKDDLSSPTAGPQTPDPGNTPVVPQ
jgi:foldase protein PrsA